MAGEWCPYSDPCQVMAYSLSLGFVIRFKDQKDAALFRLFWSDRVGA